MDPNVVKRNDLLAQKVIKGLQSRNMTGYYVQTKEEALKLALSLIPEGSTVTMGGGMSVHEIGLVDALKNGNYNYIDREAAQDRRAAMLQAYERCCRHMTLISSWPAPMPLPTMACWSTSTAMRTVYRPLPTVRKRY